MSLAGQNDPMSQHVSSSRPSPAVSAPCRRFSRGAWFARITLALVVALPAGAVGGSAFAVKKPTTAQLQAQIEAQQHVAEVASERYNAVREQLQSIQVRASAARERQRQQRLQVDAARRALGRIAAERYREGDLASLSLLLSDNPDALLAQSGLLASLGDRQAAATERLVSAQRQLDAASVDVLAQQARLQKTQSDVKAAQSAALAKVVATKQQLARLNAAQRHALEQASRGSVRIGMTCQQIGIQAPDARVAQVIAFACAHLGDRYVYGAVGPNVFDCSGYTLRAWQQAGITLPRTAAEQARAGTRVSASELRVGDLVFYHSPISHVGIYIGNGLMIHSPHTGSVVSIASVRYGSLTASARI